MGRLIARVALGLAAALAACAVYEQVASRREARELAPAGRFVDVGGRRMHLACAGRGDVTVVLESGLADWSLAWSLVQPRLAERARVCSYDRAGLGASDPSPGPFTVERAHADLNALLAAAGERPPYLLVGHSAGGLLARLYTAAHPERVRGLVLVDAAQPEMLSTLETEPAPFRHAVLSTVARLGIARVLVGALGMDSFVREARFLPEEVRRRYVAGMRARFDATPGERRLFLDAMHRAAASGSLGDVPLVVLTDHEPGQPWSERWVALQRTLPSLSTRSRQRIVEQSGHNIHFSRPELVVAAVEDLLGGRVDRALPVETVPPAAPDGR